MDYLPLIETEGMALLATTSRQLALPVPSCPGWDCRRLTRHLARLLHSVRTVVPRGTLDPPPPNPPAPAEDDELIAYYRDELAALLRVLRDTDPRLPAWNHTAAEPVAGFWRRRLAHELTVHRWDADNAVGRARPPAAEVAADGIDELLTILLPNTRAAAAANPPAGAGSSAVAGGPIDGDLHVHLTDLPPADAAASADGRGAVAGEWLVRLAGTSVTVTREHAKADVALRGPAGTVLLALWGRLPLDHPDLVAFGDIGRLRGLLSTP